MKTSLSRRDLLQVAAGILGAAGAPVRSFARIADRSIRSEVSDLAGTGRLFPADLPEAQWHKFRAEGYADSVTGIIYRMRPGWNPQVVRDKARPVSGVPLGGIDTGGLYLEASGTFGLSSIFNNYTPPGGPLNRPYLGLSIGGRVWVLTTGQTKNYVGPTNRPSMGPSLMFSWGGPHMVSSIDYWGHYPILDQEYKAGAPVGVSLRAWSPFIPGDVKASNTPGAIFEIHLKNHASSQQEASLAFSFPGFGAHQPADQIIGWPQLAKEIELPEPRIERGPVSDGLPGVWVKDSAWGMSYVLAALDEKQVRVGGELGTDGSKWAGIEKGLPEIHRDNGSSSLAVDFSLSPGEEKVVRLILAWYAPEWEGNGNPGTGGPQMHTWIPAAGLPPAAFGTTGKRFTHMYAARFRNAMEVADYLAKNHQSLLQRVIAWQSALYNSREIPGWLADSLINSFYYFAPCSVWAQAKPPIGDWCKPEDGLFAISESTRSAAQMSTLANQGMSGPFLAYFFPELALSGMRALKAYQDEKGDLPVVLGDWMDPASPKDYRYQEVMSAADYMVQLDQYWKLTGDAEFLKEFYPSAKRAMKYAFSQRPDLGPSQIIAMPPHVWDTWDDKEWFEDRHLYGYVTHPGGFRMAAAEMMREWANKIGDTECEKELDVLLKAGAKALQEHLWRGDHYLVYNDPKAGKHLDAFFSPQLNGQYYAHVHGVPPVFPKENVEKVLALMRKACTISKLGMPPDYANPDGTAWTKEPTNGYLIGQYNYCNFEIYMIAATFIYEGQKDFGMDLLRKNLEIISCKWGYTWDGGCCNSGWGDTGDVSAGWDYWFNWAVWTIPAALAGEDLRGPCRPGGLVNRIIKAGRTGSLA